MAARNLRHRFLARIARTSKIARIALAHHADDQTELFFLRLLRGASPRGLTGMKWASPSPADNKVMLIRPLLSQPRHALEAYAHEHQIQFREDKSNLSMDHERNRLRHMLLPRIRTDHQPALTVVVQRFIQLLHAEDAFLEEAADKAGRNELGPFDQLHVAIQRRLLIRACYQSGIPGNFDLIEQLRLFPGRRIATGGRQWVVRDAAGSVYVHSGSIAPQFNPQQVVRQLSGKRGTIAFEGARISWTIKRSNWNTPIVKQVAHEEFDAAKVGPQVILRHWAPGDRFQPIGMVKPVKLQDLLTNAKIGSQRRRALVLATTAQDEIFWVEGLRISDLFKIRPETRERLGWNWKRKANLSPPEK